MTLTSVQCCFVCVMLTSVVKLSPENLYTVRTTKDIPKEEWEVDYRKMMISLIGILNLRVHLVRKWMLCHRFHSWLSAVITDVLWCILYPWHRWFITALPPANSITAIFRMIKSLTIYQYYHDNTDQPYILLFFMCFWT